jgi:DNA-binding response OmpR family regulator
MPHVPVVDDDPLIRATIEACLDRHNFRVTDADAEHPDCAFWKRWLST